MNTRKLGRPKNRWIDDVLKDIKELNIKKNGLFVSRTEVGLNGSLLLRRPNDVVAPKEEE